jgi:dTMP kinase
VDGAIEHLHGRELIRRGPFARLWWATAVSSLGDWVTLFATFSLAATISGGGSRAALAILIPLVARILPGLAIGIAAGVLADRWDRRRTMVVADFGRAVLVGLLVFVGNFRDLFVLTFAIEVLSLIRQPAREAVMPQLIPGRYLMAANGLNLLAAYGSAPIGSALFAVLASTAGGVFTGISPNPGVSAAFAFDALTFVISGLMVLSIPVPEVTISSERQSRGRLDLRAPLRDLAEGFRFVGRGGPVRRLVLGMAAGLAGGGALFVLGQPFSEQVLAAGDSGYGILVTALGLGTGLGMAVVTVWGRVIDRRELVFAVALVVTGMAILLSSLTETVWGAAGWTSLTGLGTGVAYVTGFTHLHSTVTDQMRGRTFAALFAAARSGLLVSFGLAGVGAAALHDVLPGMMSSGIRAVILLSGLVVLGSGVGTLWAVRGDLRARPLDEETYRTLRDAGDAITWVKGDRRPREE